MLLKSYYKRAPYNFFTPIVQFPKHSLINIKATGEYEKSEIVGLLHVLGREMVDNEGIYWDPDEEAQRVAASQAKIYDAVKCQRHAGSTAFGYSINGKPGANFCR